MTSVATKVDMAMSYMNYLSSDLDDEDFRKFVGGVFREVGKIVKVQSETIVKELNNDRQGIGVPPNAGGTG